MKTIICPTDFSTNANNAAKYAAAFSEDLKAKLTLTYTYESPVMYTEQPFASILMADEEIRLSGEKKLSDLKSKLQKEHPRLAIHHIIAEGASADHVIEIVDAEKADLIIFGTADTSKFERLFLGNIADGIIRKAHCPVLFVPGNAKYNGIKKMIYATDLHTDNIHAASSIASFARHFNSEIVFLYVDNKHLIHTDEEVVQMISKIRSHIKYPKVSGYIAKDPSINEGINYFLKKHPAELLVMFTHSRHLAGALFHPGFTATMAHQTKIPLLSMKFSDSPILA